MTIDVPSALITDTLQYFHHFSTPSSSFPKQNIPEKEKCERLSGGDDESDRRWNGGGTRRRGPTVERDDVREEGASDLRDFNITVCSSSFLFVVLIFKYSLLGFGS